MNRPTHKLVISGPPGAVFRVTDGASRCVSTGMYRLDVDLPQGIYTVSATLGRSLETREVLLDRSQSIELKPSMLSFGDRAFSLAPDVMEMLKEYEFRPGGHFIALRGPWKSRRRFAGIRVTLDRDGTAVSAVREGFVPDPCGKGVWGWQLFELAQEHELSADDQGVLRVTRMLESKDEAKLSSASENQRTPSFHKVSHVLPLLGDRVIWAAYPATAHGAVEGADLPLTYYVRLRVTLQGAVPDRKLQSLSDQVFTALASRTILPFSKLVLDLLLLSDEADPLLAVGAAHLASIALGRLDPRRRTPLDMSPLETQSWKSELELFDVDTMVERFHTWLVKNNEGPLAKNPDFIALCFLFGIDTRAHVRVPPVFIRSLDGLLAAMESQDHQPSTITCDDSVWGMRMQISDSFAFLQWQPDADYQQLLADNIKRSFANAKAMQHTADLIEEARALVENESSTGSTTETDLSILNKARSGPRRSVRYSTVEPAATARAMDLEAFVKSNATSLRIPLSAISQVSSVFNDLSKGEGIVDAAMQHLSVGLTKD